MRVRLLVLWLLCCLYTQAQGGYFLGDLNWQQAAELVPQKTIVIPFAAGAKEHGPHLPMATDQIILEYLLNKAVADKDIIVAPPILHGWFPAFREYPGTEISQASVFQSYVEQIAESLVRSGAKRLVFLNMGINKATGLPLSIVARDIRSNHNVATLVISWEDLETEEAAEIYQQERGGHADEGETSIMLFLRPDLVRMERAQRDYRNAKKAQIGYMPGKFNLATEAGLYGDATLATAKKGQQLLQIMLNNWLLSLDQFSTVPVEQPSESLK